jgi:hypothetical protein
VSSVEIETSLFALTLRLCLKLNSELARRKSRERFAATTAFVVAPEAHGTFD